MLFESKNLTLSKLEQGDAPFVLRLVNEPSWLRYIGDRGVRDIDDAKKYIVDGPQASYQTHGFGLYVVRLKTTGIAIGMCGLLQREYLDAPDIGFALLPEFSGQGYALEAAMATMEYGKNTLNISQIVAITDHDNHRSIKLLQKLGLRYKMMVDINKAGKAAKLFTPD